MGYKLTESQKDIVRWLVQQVGDSNLAEEFSVYWEVGGCGILGFRGKDHPDITPGMLDALAAAEMIICTPDYGNPVWGQTSEVGRRCVLTGNAREAVDSDFKMSEMLWLTKRASEQVQMRVPEIIQAIQKWVPKQRYKAEEAYVAALAEYLVGLGIDAPEQQGKSLTDILAAHGIGTEVKLTPDRSEYDRLAGQIMRQLEEYGIVIVLILRPDKRDLLEEYKSRFDDRVIFITKG